MFQASFMSLLWRRQLALSFKCVWRGLSTTPPPATQPKRTGFSSLLFPPSLPPSLCLLLQSCFPQQHSPPSWPSYTSISYCSSPYRSFFSALPIRLIRRKTVPGVTPSFFLVQSVRVPVLTRKKMFCAPLP
uniref:Putative secreted protein n=1 Tax=Desmodus rotundus TaxID=9430 RepID=K9IGA7_DESRO